MRRLLLTLLLVLVAAPAANAATLVNDPTHPFSAKDFAAAQRYVTVAATHVHVPDAVITLTHDVCPGAERVGGGCAGPGHIWLLDMDEYGFDHELGHEDQMLGGTPRDNEGVQITTWTDQKEQAIAHLLHLSADNWWESQSPRPAVEVSADAYSICAMNGNHWMHWWRHRLKTTQAERKAGLIGGEADTSTAYNFRAGPVRYRQICRALR